VSANAASNEPSDPGGTATKRTRSPGAASDDGVRPESKKRVVVRPMICQPPGVFIQVCVNFRQRPAPLPVPSP